MRTLGRYQLLARLASGSLGEVFAAHAEDDDVAWAVQILPPDLNGELRFARRLLTEANSASRVTHRAAAVPREAIREGGELMVVAPLVAGPTLAAVLKLARMERQGIAQSWICHIGAEVAEALAAAHRIPWFPGAPAPMVHGALSPRAIHLTYDGRVVVTGLGVGRARAVLAPGAARLAYAAPERLQGRDPTPRTDGYGLALILYDALSGKRTFQRANEEDTRAAIREANIAPLHSGNLTVSPAVADLLQSFLAPREDARPSRLDELARVLRVAAGQPAEEMQAHLARHLAEVFAEDRENLGRKLGAARRHVPAPRPAPIAAADDAWTADLAAVPDLEIRKPNPDGLLASDTLQDTAPAGVVRLGRYLLQRTVSTGGPRQVHLGVDPNLDRPVVVHTLDGTEIEDPRLASETWVKLFKLEARYAAQLDHPGLPLLLDAGRHEQRYFAVYRQRPGVDLAAWLEKEGPLSAERVERLAADWAAALAALHAAGFVHGDVRAANLLICPERGGAVIDLSMAQPLTGPPHPLAAGNLLVQAPETLAGGAYDARAEQFALGGVIYQALVGTRPFRGLVDEELAEAIRRAEPRWPSEMGVDASEPLEGVLRRLLAPQPRQRFDSMAEVAAALGAGTARIDKKRPPLAEDLAPPRPRPSVEAWEALTHLAVHARDLAAEVDEPAVRSAGSLARRYPGPLEEAAEAPLVAALAGLWERSRWGEAEVEVAAFVPEPVRPALQAWLGLERNAGPGPHPRAAELAWLATRYHRLARPPEGEGSQSPRSAVRRLRQDASERQVSLPAVELFIEWLRDRLSALDLSERVDERILVAGGDGAWSHQLEAEGFDVVRVEDGHAAWAELSGGGYFGAVVTVDLPGKSGRALIRLGRSHPELKSMHFALVGATLEPEDHGPNTWAVPSPSPEAVKAVVRGWRTP